jgi:hypothetical protein
MRLVSHVYCVLRAYRHEIQDQSHTTAARGCTTGYADVVFCTSIVCPKARNLAPKGVVSDSRSSVVIVNDKRGAARLSHHRDESVRPLSVFIFVSAGLRKLAA